MKQPTRNWDLIILLLAFIISRLILPLVGIQMDVNAINVYWQYLSVDTLQHNLLNGLWYNHTQPPMFNLLLGMMLKIFGSAMPVVIPFLFKLITVANILLLYKSLKLLTQHRWLPLMLAMLFMLSPATMILENELFYTSFMTMLLLLSCYNLLRFSKQQSYLVAWGIFLPLAIASLTRSMYNISWLIVVSLALIIYFKKSGVKKLSIIALACTVLAGSWYVKNLVMFGKFTTSTWLGMNLARNVFHDHSVKDSTRIESIEPFSSISAYNNFITGDLAQQYAGLNDRELLSEYKNGPYINEHHINYIEVSDRYAEASKGFVKDHPASYLKNVLQSAIIFFTPATRYPFAEKEAVKMKYYDVVYSFNMNHFAEGKEQRRWAVVISAIPKMLMYVVTFGVILLAAKRSKSISAINLFIVLTFAYIFAVSSLLEHYENMRFRFEIEPLFLLLLGQVLAKWLSPAKEK
ncbi:MAG: hypothetical protein EOO03_00500 [Chitinophagaceae bacterium]|nr:MAG: hypothetical protein EOO03_00500 [Chitinophagaceae bacterium]